MKSLPTERLSEFAKFAWFTLAYNILVILWGVFLRASKSGDGCGQHWLTCQGEVIPSAPELKTIIEFSHRMTTGPAFLFVLILAIWAFRKFAKGHPARMTSMISLFFIVTEALVGAGLVLTGNTAETLTDARPFWAVGHLIMVFIRRATNLDQRTDKAGRINFPRCDRDPIRRYERIGSGLEQHALSIAKPDRRNHERLFCRLEYSASIATESSDTVDPDKRVSIVSDRMAEVGV
ncbi:MAG: hypothetical protein DMF63_09165 [Acidobacteria bacterium]|nr:MAG: hypothetical protein DMF63_09165 [Acidobacteriota bacterium]